MPTEVDCKKHGRCRVICVSSRNAEFQCIACWEARVEKAKAEGKRLHID